MLWLLSQGHRVIGVELSEIACKAFFVENKLAFTLLYNDTFTIYKGDNIEIWCGDIFKLPTDAYKNVTVVYDRAALIALPVDLRLLYITFVKNIVKLYPDIYILLITLEYPSRKIKGPPFSISYDSVQAYYQDTFVIKKLLLPDNYISVFDGNPKFDGIKTRESVYLLSSY